jgi:hypothetical protein
LFEIGLAIKVFVKKMVDIDVGFVEKVEVEQVLTSEV